jgi:hypothetical protein
MYIRKSKRMDKNPGEFPQIYPDFFMHFWLYDFSMGYRDGISSISKQLRMA